jgi:predicted transcriptional regulator
MNKDMGLEKLFFELASESRLSILRELKGENLKMQEIARRLDVTPTEAFRQLERLSTSSLVQRQPDGTFALAEVGKIVLQISASLGFILKYKGYFSTHDLMQFPSPLVSRVGELSKAELLMDTIESLNRGAKWFTEATQYIWAVGEGTIPEYMIPIISQKIQSGIQIKMLLPLQNVPFASQSGIQRNVEMRGLSIIPGIIALTEKYAGVCFRRIDGKMDYEGFYGTDPTFHNWVKDLFLYYWEKGKQA